MVCVPAKPSALPQDLPPATRRLVPCHAHKRPSWPQGRCAPRPRARDGGRRAPGPPSGGTQLPSRAPPEQVRPSALLAMRVVLWRTLPPRAAKGQVAERLRRTRRRQAPLHPTNTSHRTPSSYSPWRDSLGSVSKSTSAMALMGRICGQDKAQATLSRMLWQRRGEAGRSAGSRPPHRELRGRRHAHGVEQAPKTAYTPKCAVSDGLMTTGRD